VFEMWKPMWPFRYRSGRMISSVKYKDINSASVDFLQYFAYGSNLDQTKVSKYCPSSKLLGPARLTDYQLAFTRRRQSGTGAADIIPAHGMSVWGALYKIHKSELTRLDSKEGHPQAYERIDVTVHIGDESCRAMTYTVTNKEDREVAPSPKYLSELVEASAKVGLPQQYRGFLESLRAEPPENFRAGLVVRGTEDRSGATGMNIVRVQRDTVKAEGLGSFAVVAWQGRAVVAKVMPTDDIDEGCQLDQTLRESLHFPGRASYGHKVTIHPLKRRIVDSPLLRPRSLVLPVFPPAWLDSEKNLCILHPRNIAQLGLVEGEYVNIICVVRAGEQFRMRKLTLRVFGGSTGQIVVEDVPDIPDVPENYPQSVKIYLDADARRALGLAVASSEYPVLVRPNVARLFASRALYYGITLVIGVSTILEVLQAFRVAATSSAAQAAIALTSAVALTCLLTLLDLRGRLQY
jgi:gamma-glutamylcyclotransferase